MEEDEKSVGKNTQQTFAFTLNIPIKEYQALKKKANEIGVSVTMSVRLWIRQDLMQDPIGITPSDRK